MHVLLWNREKSIENALPCINTPYQNKVFLLKYRFCRKIHTCVGKFKAFFIMVAYFILSRLLSIAFLANLGLLCMQHPGMGPLV